MQLFHRIIYISALEYRNIYCFNTLFHIHSFMKTFVDFIFCLSFFLVFNINMRKDIYPSTWCKLWFMFKTLCVILLKKKERKKSVTCRRKRLGRVFEPRIKTQSAPKSVGWSVRNYNYFVQRPDSFVQNFWWLMVEIFILSPFSVLPYHIILNGSTSDSSCVHKFRSNLIRNFIL